MPTPIPATTATLFPFVLGEPDANTVVRSVSQTMLSDIVEQTTFEVLAANRVFFFGAFPAEGQEATHNFVYEDVSNVLAGGNISGYDQELDILQYLGFSGDHVDVSASNSMFSSLIGDEQILLIEQVENVTDVFSWLEHDEEDVFPRALCQSYNTADTMLSDIVTGGSSEDVSNFFDFSSVTDTGATDFGRDSQQIAIKQHVDFFIQGAECVEKEYAPYIGSSDDDDYDPVSTTPPVLGDATLTLTHPRVSPTTTLELKNPEFGNDDSITWTRIDRQTLGGDRIIYSDPAWANFEAFRLTVRNIDEQCHATIDDIVNFLNVSLGEEIGLLDWENRQWKGIISAPDSDITTEASGHTVTIVFEGELV